MATCSTLPLRDKETKLQHILLRSAEIFANQGFAGTSMRDISRATGISLSGLYYYFESKQKLLYLIQINAFTSLLESAEARLTQAQDPEARLRALVRNHIEYFLSHPSEMKVLSHEEEALEPPFREEIAAIKRRYYALARKIFDDATAGAELPDTLSPRLAVLSLFGMMNWIYKWHNAKTDPNAEQLSEAIVGIFLRGVLGDSAEEKAVRSAVLTSD